MTDEPKNKTIVESPPLAEAASETSPALATTTVIEPVSPPDAAASDGELEPNDTSVQNERQTRGFDPYRFQRMTVPPGLRSEMAQVKLPRLSHEYFKETLPPPTMKAALEPASTPVEGPDASVSLIETGSDAPTAFEPSERTPISLAVPMSSTPRTVLWGALGLVVGVILLFIARELTKEEPRLAVPPPEAQVTASPPASTSEPVATAIEAAESARSGQPVAESAAFPSVPPPPPVPSASSLGPTLPAATAPASPPEPRKSSGPAAPSSQGQGSAQNTKRLWITPR